MSEKPIEFMVHAVASRNAVGWGSGGGAQLRPNNIKKKKKKEKSSLHKTSVVTFF